MADGSFAVAMLVLGLLDMGRNHCGTDQGCLGVEDVTPRWSLSVGSTLPRRALEEYEIFLRRDLGIQTGPFGYSFGLSAAENGEYWIGFGPTWHHEFDNSPIYVELHLMPGVYFDNGGFDLGGPVNFRSGIEIGMETRTGVRYALSYDHRSNLDFYGSNPGVETVQFRVSIPLGRR